MPVTVRSRGPRRSARRPASVPTPGQDRPGPTDTLMGISRQTGPRAGSRIHRRVMDRSSGIVDSQEWDQRYAGAELVWTAQPNRFVVDELQPCHRGRALDLGAGEGRNAIWLAGRGWQVTAVDFSAAGLDKGRRLAEAHGLAIDWVHADLRDYQPDEGSCQLVLVAYLQLREAELDGVLRRAVAALAAGGVLLVVGHDVTNLTEGVGGPLDPAVLYTPESMKRALGGLTVLRAERFGARSPQARRWTLWSAPSGTDQGRPCPGWAGLVPACAQRLCRPQLWRCPGWVRELAASDDARGAGGGREELLRGEYSCSDRRPPRAGDLDHQQPERTLTYMRLMSPTRSPWRRRDW